LDSLLAGYPIGSLLLCKAPGVTTVLEEKGTTRVAVEAPGAWHLLDGQQRIHALAALFSSFSGKSRFYLHMSAERVPDLKVGRKDPRIHNYIVWDTQPDLSFEGPRGSQSDRSHWLDLERFGEALLHGEEPPVGKAVINIPECREWLKKVDKEFSNILQGKENIFCDRVTRLWSWWSEEKIPVQSVSLNSIDDVLQVFARANMEGVRTSAVDIFFAGVKTQWHDAEEYLDKLRQRSRQLLDRLTSLRIVARVIQYKLTGEDLLPLTLDRLRPPGGKDVVNKMQELLQSDAVLARVEQFSAFLVNESGIGHGLDHVDWNLLDHVFGWAMVGSHMVEDFSAAGGYLVWGTAFRLHTVFGDTYSRFAMKECLDAGRAGRPFPIQEILQQTHTHWSDLVYNRKTIPLAENEQDRRNMIHGCGRLFLSVAQGVGFADRERVEWDHIYAQALAARKMKWRGPAGEGRRRYHSNASLAWRTGNLCALDKELNVRAQYDAPEEKLSKLRQGEYGKPLWPENLVLHGDIERELITAEKLLENESIEKGMQAFRDYVEKREDELWRVAMGKYPQVDLFMRILRPGAL
jgi:hypothetical protein